MAVILRYPVAINQELFCMIKMGAFEIFIEEGVPVVFWITQPYTVRVSVWTFGDICMFMYIVYVYSEPERHPLFLLLTPHPLPLASPHSNSLPLIE